MADQAGWPNVEDVAIGVLADLVQDGHADTVTPADLDEQCPWLRVRRIGGGDIDPFTDRARIAVDAFALTYADGRDLAEAVRQRLLTSPHPLDRVATVTGPVEQPWADSSPVRRWTGTYAASLRRPTT